MSKLSIFGPQLGGHHGRKNTTILKYPPPFCSLRVPRCILAPLGFAWFGFLASLGFQVGCSWGDFRLFWFPSWAFLGRFCCLEGLVCWSHFQEGLCTATRTSVLTPSAMTFHIWEGFMYGITYTGPYTLGHNQHQLHQITFHIF